MFQQSDQQFVIDSPPQYEEILRLPKPQEGVFILYAFKLSYFNFYLSFAHLLELAPSYSLLFLNLISAPPETINAQIEQIGAHQQASKSKGFYYFFTIGFNFFSIKIP